MIGRVLVLDTNVARFAHASKLEAWAKKGHRLRIGETAYLEWYVQGAKMLAENRPRARGVFFGRAKQIAQFLDPEVPIAPSGGILARKMVAEADGEPIPNEYHERVTGLAGQWSVITGIELTDEEWVRWCKPASDHLDALDAELINLALPEAEIEKKIPPDMKAANEAWKALCEAEQLPALRMFVKDSLRLSDAAAERADVHICTMALRMHVAARGARLPKRNDGADVWMPVHVGEGSVAVTDERRLIDIVDQSGTFQAPWIRNSDDLDELPHGPPWGESAREQARAFKRRT